ncbi:hypothetical protein A3A64_03595 [Candidatus Gottesmanbacteria bacterium RIFCSPLOWO2_01_FULL_48_11]|uniref:Carbohydrate kinase PfkB domain-containing protein n=1 Tax=Candidatus Gottesmanbacteria bacterium RIFCSPLOWO2_01_FULL_48_11 TaxID=1798395 RepID=A0A1F6AUT9_9BACT|nr:MAG: Fructoselysine kinase [Parcubacteria group bacterium GW2011_GWA1_49_11]OGG28398.1 MAG: hypothetical protein A3A64_03595 [Candidatus Gottesmanbacteria bacterium RIFCSPLOWO2_01_FULL_48_11]
MTPRIAFIGDLTIDVYPQRRRVHLSGSSLNSSIWAKRLGATPSIVAAVGEDASGKKFLQKLKHEDIDATHVRTLPGKTSSIEIFTDKSGEHRFGDWNPGVLAKFHLDESDAGFFKKQHAVSLTVYGPTRHLLDEFVRFGAGKKHRLPLVSVDFDDLSQLGKDADVVESCMGALDVAFLGLDKDVDEDLINRLKQVAAESGKLIIVTLAAYGAIAFLGSQSFIHPAPNVRVKDTTGAGDAFIAGFLVSYLRKRSVPQALRIASQTAGQAIQHLGAY